MEINQKYVADVRLYQGRKIVLDKVYSLRFRPNKEDVYAELDCIILKEGQKTLSSMKPSQVIVESDLTVDDIGDTIKAGASFTLLGDYQEKIGKGKITEVVKQV